MRIIDHDDVTAAAGQRAGERGGQTSAAGRGLDVAGGAATQPRVRKDELVPPGLHDREPLAGKVRGKIVRIAQANEVERGIDAKHERHPGDGHDRGFEVARRHRDHQPLAFTLGNQIELIG